MRNNPLGHARSLYNEKNEVVFSSWVVRGRCSRLAEKSLLVASILYKNVWFFREMSFSCVQFDLSRVYD